MMERVGKQLGHYQLLRLLGRGGFASVYLGEHIHLKSLAAVKVLYTRLTEDLQENFRNEARILAGFSHASIIRLLDFGIDEGVPFLVMEYAPHGTLRQLHPSPAKLPLVTVVNYINQIADGLQYAHDQKLIHRDLKPDNVLIGLRGNLLLSDFGVALIAQTTGSRNPETSFAGTAAYMAPEQLRGVPEFASDQYALGIMVYEWLCGTRPFQGTIVELYSQHACIPPRPLREHVPDLPGEVEQVVLRALSKEPGERFPNVKTFAAALEQACQAGQAAMQFALRPASPHIDDVTTPPTLPQDNASTNPHTSRPPDLFTPLTSFPQPEPSTSAPAPLPPSGAEPSTWSKLFLASSPPVLQSEPAVPSQAHLPTPQPVQLQKLSALPLNTQPAREIADTHHFRKKLPRKAISLLVALILLIILLVGSTTLYIFSQGKQSSAGGTASTQITTLGLSGSAPPSGVINTPGASVTTPDGTPSSNAMSSSNSTSSPTSVSSSNGVVSATGTSSSTSGTSSSTGVITPTAQPVSPTRPASIPAPTPTSASTSKPPAPTPTPAAQVCTTHNWTISSATSQTGSFTTSANCSAIKVTLSSGLLTQITIQACTSSGCGPSLLVLLGNSATLLSNVPPKTSFYLKTTSILSLNATSSGVVSC